MHDAPEQDYSRSPRLARCQYYRYRAKYTCTQKTYTSVHRQYQLNVACQKRDYYKTKDVYHVNSLIPVDRKAYWKGLRFARRKYHCCKVKDVYHRETWNTVRSKSPRPVLNNSVNPDSLLSGLQLVEPRREVWLCRGRMLLSVLKS